jgi:hypothetical protein
MAEPQGRVADVDARAAASFDDPLVELPGVTSLESNSSRFHLHASVPTPRFKR